MDETLAVASQAIADGHMDVARQLLMGVVRTPAGAQSGRAWHLLSLTLSDAAQRADCRQRATKLGFVPTPTPSASASSTTPVPAMRASLGPTPTPAPISNTPQPQQATSPAPETMQAPALAPVSKIAPAAVVGGTEQKKTAGQRVGRFFVKAAVGIMLGLGGLYALLMYQATPHTPAAPRPTVAVGTPVPCSIQAHSFFGEINTLFASWNDVSTLASSTSRIALAPVVSSMQKLRRELDGINTPPCAASTRNALRDHMDYMIRGYLQFMAQAPESEVQANFTSAKDQLERFTQEISQVK